MQQPVAADLEEAIARAKAALLEGKATGAKAEVPTAGPAMLALLQVVDGLQRQLGALQQDVAAQRQNAQQSMAAGKVREWRGEAAGEKRWKETACT